jgi:hypothetical protein
MFDKLVRRKLKSFKSKHKNNPRVDRVGNMILNRLTDGEFIKLWEPYRLHPEVFRPNWLQVCRTEDVGHYEIGNIRIDTARNNILERNMHYTNAQKLENKRHLGNVQSLAVDAALSEASRNKRLTTFSITNHQQGERNNQYGSFWITNGVYNVKCKSGESIPLGFYKGRVM